MGMNKGRPRLPGARYPGGQRKPSARIEPEGKAPAVWGRILRLRDDIEAMRKVEDVGTDSRMGTELHRLKFVGRITEVEWATGCLVAEIYAAHDRLVLGTRRHMASPSYMRGFGNGETTIDLERMEPGDRRRFERRAEMAKRRWERVQKTVTAVERGLLEEVCVNDRACPAQLQGLLASALYAIAKEFDVVAAAKMASPAEHLRRNTVKPKTPQRAKKVSHIKQDFCAVIAKLRPDLTEGGRDQAFNVFLALQDRTKFRKSKDRRVR